MRAASASRSYDVWTSNPDSVIPSGGSDDGLLVAEDGSDHPSEAHQSGHGGEGETWSLVNRLGVETPSMLSQRRRETPIVAASEITVKGFEPKLRRR